MAPRRFKPERALLHPLWLGALALLVVNDHVLKGADLLPTVVTGKLSDFAGLIVAPLLLAVVVRAKNERVFAGAAVVTAAVFSAIQLWQGAADALSFVLATTRDPTDLLALAVLPLAHGVFTRAATAPDAGLHVRRSAQWSAATVGLFACMGTSPPERPVFYSDFWGDVYINNPTEQETVVLIRLLRTDIEIDCDAIGERPGELLTEELFGTGRTWSIPPTANVPLRSTSPWQEEEQETQPECFAAWVSGDTLAPHLAFWERNQPPLEFKPGNTFNEDELEVGALVLGPREDGDGFTLDDREAGLLFDVLAPVEPSGPACAPPSDADRLDWSVPLPVGEFDLDVVTHGADGCAELEMGATRWYLCVPEAVFPFVAGDAIRIEQTSGPPTVAGGYDGLVMTKLDAVGGAPAAGNVQLVVSRGTGAPQYWDFGVTVGGTCEHVAQSDCGTVARNLLLTFVGEGTVAEVPVGTVVTDVPSPVGGAANFAVMHAQSRVLVDTACALGPDVLGNDLEIAASHTYGP